MFRQRDSGEEDGDGCGDDPERGQEAAESKAVGRCFFSAKDRGDCDPREGGPVEDALGGVRRPDDDQDEAVADAQFGDVSDAR